MNDLMTSFVLLGSPKWMCKQSHKENNTVLRSTAPIIQNTVLITQVAVSGN